MAPRVETHGGSIEGIQDEGLQRFLGIPYARPPHGDLRFAPPREPETWSGVRAADRYGAAPHQGQFMLSFPGMEVGETGEDCLSLNVFTPAADGGRRPVLVWIHGGGFVLGASSQVVYEGSALSRRGDAVVVTLNYRLGAFGFMDLTRVCPELPGAVANAGILDQLKALNWVQRNIAAFGGDPDNVTIFGESAGGMSVGTLLGTPSARGLFHKAIAMSGAAHNCHDRDAADSVARAFLEALGVAPGDAAGVLRSLPPEKLIEAQQAATAALRSAHGLLPFQPVHDGVLLPEPPLEAVRGGLSAGVPLLVGHTREEWKLFAPLDPTTRDLADAGLLDAIAVRHPEIDAGHAVELYREVLGSTAEAVDLLAALATDRVFRIPAIELAEAQGAHTPAVWMYRFDWCSPMLDGAFGACHGVDIPFVFGGLDLPFASQFAGQGEAAEALARRTMDAWLAFARTGDPGGPDLPDWPPYEGKRRATLCLGERDQLRDAPGERERAFWAAA